MNTWWWVAIGTGSFFVLSLLVALALARVLGQIGRDISDLFEDHHWASAPPSRETHEEREQEPPAKHRQSRSGDGDGATKTSHAGRAR